MRGTSNSNSRGSSYTRRKRKEWLYKVYGSDLKDHCRCYRCGFLVCDKIDCDVPSCLQMSIDRIKPGCKGGKYVQGNIRPACMGCNSKTGGQIRAAS